MAIFQAKFLHPCDYLRARLSAPRNQAARPAGEIVQQGGLGQGKYRLA